MTDSQKSNSTPTSPLGRVLKWYGRRRFRVYGTIAASILSIPVGIIGVVIDSTMLQAIGITLATMGAIVVASMLIASMWDDYLASRSK